MNDMSMSRQTPIQANQELTATLEAREWSIVLAGLYELPQKISRAVTDKLAAQLQTMGTVQ